ncbi:hypothetical protein PIROE2DRAFT_51247 [Piromyces sp. E2]|nr:hypothetical protein PIROE2DRAFT_51247 [Piromyces sp. E2]|eukprot:OUM64564.1 hypothetical protein PIROE2DRAFT_51247 [Piromyces sp. E2]
MSRKERELYEKHQVSNRLHIIGSIWLVFLIGIPIWWKTTEVYRASLPYKEVQKWQDPNEEIKKMRTFKYASNYQILYSLFNGNINDYIVNWEIEKAIKSYFGPFFDTLSLISKFDVSSQVQNFATLPLTAKYSNSNENAYYYLEAKDLGHFINSAEWNLASPVSTAPPINFILYIPPISQSPLHIHDSKGDKLETNAFLIPRWGGIVIDKNRNTTNADANANGNKNYYNYSFDDLHPVMELFLDQLRSLLGINEIKFLPTDLPRNVRVLYSADSKRGITSWELDQLLRKRTVQNLVNASRTLNSLAKLVGSLPNMVVLDKIQEKVVFALECLENAYKEVNGRNYKQVFLYSKNALIASEEAFFDPTMVSMLYFPDEHKYAVYMPLFLPISVPLALVLKEEFKKRKKVKKEKNNNEVNNKENKETTETSVETTT